MSDAEKVAAGSEALSQARMLLLAVEAGAPKPELVLRVKDLISATATDADLIAHQAATIAARDDELIGERWHADEAARQRDVAKAALTAAEADRERLTKHARAMSDALVKVRPLAGSEMFSRVGEEFYADPKFCGAEIERLRAENNELRNRAIRAERRAALSPKKEQDA